MHRERIPCVGPFAEHLPLTLTDYQASIRASHAFERVWPPALLVSGLPAGGAGPTPLIAMLPEALARLVQLAADGDLQLEQALTLAVTEEDIGNDGDGLWREPLRSVARARRRRATATPQEHDERLAPTPALAALARMKRALQCLARKADQARQDGDSLDVIDVYDAGSEALGLCVECGAWPGEPHQRAECETCPDEIFWGSWFTPSIAASSLQQFAQSVRESEGGLQLTLLDEFDLSLEDEFTGDDDGGEVAHV